MVGKAESVIILWYPFLKETRTTIRRNAWRGRISLCDPSPRLRSSLKTRFQRRGISSGAAPRARSERHTCKEDQGAEKPEKFIKRFLSWRRRTSVSDLLARSGLPSRGFAGEVRLEAVDGVRRSSKLPRNADVGYHPLFTRYPPEFSSPPLPSAPPPDPPIDFHSIDGQTLAFLSLPSPRLLALCL